MEKQMENEQIKKAEQTQDLGHHKPEETDNIQKSERPAKDYCDSREIDPETQGKKQ